MRGVSLVLTDLLGGRYHIIWQRTCQDFPFLWRLLLSFPCEPAPTGIFYAPTSEADKRG